MALVTPDGRKIHVMPSVESQYEEAQERIKMAAHLLCNGNDPFDPLRNDWRPMLTYLLETCERQAAELHALSLVLANKKDHLGQPLIDPSAFNRVTAEQVTEKAVEMEAQVQAYGEMREQARQAQQAAARSSAQLAVETDAGPAIDAAPPA